MPSSVQTLNKSNFYDKLQTEKLVVLEFRAPWSEPCKYVQPKLEKLAKEKEKEDAVFYALDITEFKDLAEWLDVEALPTFVLVHKFFLKGRVIGVDVDELRNEIGKFIKSNKMAVSSSP